MGEKGRKRLAAELAQLSGYPDHETALAALKRPRFVGFTEHELSLLHWCVVHHAPRPAFKGPLPQEDLELKDLEARLATAIEAPVVLECPCVLRLPPDEALRLAVAIAEVAKKIKKEGS